jgi:hypothetical protein
VIAIDRVTALTAIVAVETVVLALMALLLVGLLRSHAEILRRLPDDADPEATGAGHHDHRAATNDATIPDHLPGPRAEATPVVDIVGATLDGGRLSIAPAKTDTLIAFLSSGCFTCRTFWDELQPSRREPLPDDARLVIVVKDREMESPSRLQELAPSDIPVVMSSQAWDDYGVTLSPYFLFVGAWSGTVRSEGAASTWPQVRSLLADAIADERLAEDLARGR